MNAKDLSEAFESMVDALSSWTRSAWSPGATCDALLNAAGSEQERVRGTAKLWTVAAVMTTIVQLPALRSAGIAGDDMGYFLPHILGVLGALLCGAWALHTALRIGRIPSKFVDTLTVSTVYSSIFTPMLALVSLPSSIALFHGIVAAKKAGLPFGAALLTAFQDSGKPGPDQVWLHIGIAVLLCALPFWYGLMARSLAEHYAAPKLAVVRSIAFSFSMLVPATMVLMAFEFFVLFTCM